VRQLSGTALVQSRTHNGEPVHNVVVVGGGQSGVRSPWLDARAVLDVIVLDRKSSWTGRPLRRHSRGCTSLRPRRPSRGPISEFQASRPLWYEARFGAQAWERLDKIPRDLGSNFAMGRETVGHRGQKRDRSIRYRTGRAGCSGAAVRGATDGRPCPTCWPRKNCSCHRHRRSGAMASA